MAFVLLAGNTVSECRARPFFDYPVGNTLCLAIWRCRWRLSPFIGWTPLIVYFTLAFPDAAGLCSLFHGSQACPLEGHSGRCSLGRFVALCDRLGVNCLAPTASGRLPCRCVLEGASASPQLRVAPTAASPKLRLRVFSGAGHILRRLSGPLLPCSSCAWKIMDPSPRCLP